MSLNQHTGIDEFKPTYGYWCTCHISVYTPGKKYCNTLIFSLDKIVRRKCSIIGRNLLKILPECFKLNHWYMTAANRFLILPTKRRIWTWVRRCHSWCSVCFNSFKVWTNGVLSFTRRPIMSQICSVGFKSGFLACHGSVVIDSSHK